MMNQDIYVLVEHLNDQVGDITFMMLAQARQICQQTGGKVMAVLLGNDVSGLAKDLNADSVLYYDHPSLKGFSWDAYLRVLSDLLKEAAPRIALFGDTTVGSEVASGLSGRLGFPLLSYCRTIQVVGNSLKYTCQTCGGKLMVEGDVPEESVLVTQLLGGFKVEEGKGSHPPVVSKQPVPDLSGLRVTLKKYIEPASGDVDITKEPLLIAVGRGIQREDNMELINDLANAMGGVVCATRPVIDQNWLPTTRLVGKSGKTVKPKLYLALGVSGAPEHTEAITGSDLIIAVNTDPTAPIFDIAKYGTTVDMLDLLPALTERVQQAKG
jgi:electron transfer flavoprotein alpha subunit